MEPYGRFEKGIMVIGEAPGAEEDQEGKPWQGVMGRSLQRAYEQLGIDLFRDCVSLNSVNCRPTSSSGSNRAPTSKEIACCNSKVLRAIDTYKPHVIILHGGAAVTSLIGSRWKGMLGGITKGRGCTIQDTVYNAWLCPTYHPSYVAREKNEGAEVEIVWKQDLMQAFSKIDEELPPPLNENNCVHIVENEDEAFDILDGLLKDPPPLLAIDIETTGLKPYNKAAHQIVAISLCPSEDVSFAMPFPTNSRVLRKLTKVLQHPRIGKIAANMKFEDTWLAVMSDIAVRPWVFDTMQAAHILDNRPGITGLKFQSYVRFGVVGYDDEMAPYLRSPDSNSPNRLLSIAKEGDAFRKLLLYNGMDSLLTYRLAMLQKEELQYDLYRT